MDDVTDVSIDSFSEISTESSDIPMSEPAPQAAPEEFEFTALGKPIKAPREKVLQWASQGYDYSQKMADFNRQRTEFDTQYKTYSEIDRFAQENPEWWSYIQNQYSQRNQYSPQEQTSLSSQASPELQPILSEIQELRKFRDEFMAEKSAKMREQEDAQLKEQIESIRKTYTNLDFQSPGEDGKSLEMKVLEYAAQNGINNFKTAFRDFYHEKLIERAREEGKELAAKEVQKRTKLGLLGESSAPKKQVQPLSDVKNRSYDDGLQEALEELGLLGSSLRS